MVVTSFALVTQSFIRSVVVSSQPAMYQTRREFLHGLTLASTAGVLGFGPRAVTAAPALETTTIRLVKIPTICQAPQYVAE